MAHDYSWQPFRRLYFDVRERTQLSVTARGVKHDLLVNAADDGLVVPRVGTETFAQTCARILGAVSRDRREIELACEELVAAGYLVIGCDGLYLRDFAESQLCAHRLLVQPSVGVTLLRAIEARDQGLCRYCGRKPDVVHIDHVQPKSRGGGNTIENLVTACAPCNLSKGARTPFEAGMTLLPPPEVR